MPSLTQSFAKKRRRDEDGVENDICVTFPPDFHTYYPRHEDNGSPPRKFKPFSSPVTKKLRIATPEWSAAAGEETYTPLSPPRQTASSLRHHYLHNDSNNSRSTIPRLQSQPTRSKQIVPTIPVNALAPCHICHRRPTKKTELDSYADCEGCGERTCYVCIRECLGAWKSPIVTTVTTHEDIMRDEEEAEAAWKECQEAERLDQSFTMEDAPPTTDDDDNNKHMSREGTWGEGGGGTGHRDRICSQCCVEEGPEGDVICLGCLGT